MVKYRYCVENWCSHVPKRKTPVGGADVQGIILPTPVGGISIEYVNVLVDTEVRTSPCLFLSWSTAHYKIDVILGYLLDPLRLR